MITGKTAVVTGGSRGIGAAVVKRLAENGADVAIVYAGNTEKAEAVAAETAAMGRKAKIYQCNVADFSETAAITAKIMEDFGAVDILVNNAGITRDKLIIGMKEEDFDAVLNVNLKGAFHMMRQICPVMAKKRSGKIINISSVAGLIGNPGQANYSASKAGLVGLTKTVAKELAARGVNCNAIAPGFIKTDMTENFVTNDAILSSIPMKRAGAPENVADLVLFLASPMSDYITGEVIKIDGGLAI